jgi:DNA-binding response OmpR family regulator
MRSTKVPHDEQILVVEDHHDSAELLQMILEDEGYQVRCVETGRDALRVLTPTPVSETSEFYPDLILLDLRLPDMNGAEMVKELQKNQTEVPPVIILSADSPKSLKMAATSVGATAIRKPFAFDNLFQEIESALDKRRKSDD